ncbi:MAG: preprotein translocase subunit SecG [Caldilinea sp.]|nr:preprotein translocase subunit SecG [Caldilinea sp.]MCB0059882.1 preprotein translocase subunit SecG [Caldilineaceae bacterium]MCB0040448.1 preprotein translocase subunit SecG [Caldilinea sp.]MCB0050586.1 preprotein translocase subunit SecG [Caldilinea sp.]MCB0135374.1 preprotein translocase subunit SecG [Caldilineaceae bacterium]
MNITTFLMIAMNIVAIALISVVVIQGQTGAGLGAVFGGSDIYRTRRGIEKTLWQLTFVLTAVFLLLCLVTVMLA